MASQGGVGGPSGLMHTRVGRQPQGDPVRGEQWRRDAWTGYHEQRRAQAVVDHDPFITNAV